jgi:hypothetical protein
MSISEFEGLPEFTLGGAEPLDPDSLPGDALARSAHASPPEARRPEILHRLREVRREQGVSSRRAAQLLGISVEQLRHDEDPETDLSLTQIYEWQKLLEVPVSDLLVEPHAPLSAPVMRRAQLVRLMKTVQAIVERASQTSVRRLGQTMINQLIEIMPELEGVTPWHSLDRRTQNQNSRILEQTYLPSRPPEPR